MKRAFTPDELNELEQKGYNMSSYKGELVEFPDPEKTSTATGAAARSLVSGAIPATAGAAGFAGGMAGGAALGAELGLAGGPFAPVTVPAASIIGGIGGGMIASGAAKWIQDKLTPQSVLDRNAVVAAEHPVATRVGELGAMALTMRPSIGMTKEALQGIPQLIPSVGAKTVVNTASREALKNVGLGAGISGATETGRQLVTGEGIDPGKIAEETLIGAAFNKPTALGHVVMGSKPVLPRTVDSEDAFRKTFAPLTPPGKESVPVTPKVSRENEIVEMGKAALEEIAQDNAAKTKQIAELQKNQEDLQKGVLSALEEINYQKDTTTTTPLQQEVEAGLLSRKLSPTKVTPTNREVSDSLLRDQNIGVVENPELGAKGMMVPANPKREVTINPLKEDTSTRTHEGQHYLYGDLQAEAANGSKPAARLLKNLQELQEQSRVELNKARTAKGEEPYSPEEFAVSEQGFEFIKQQLNLTKETSNRKWWNDTKALWNVRFEKNPSVEDIRRALNFRYVHGKDVGSIGKTGPLGATRSSIAAGGARAMSSSEGFNSADGDEAWSNSGDENTPMNNKMPNKQLPDAPSATEIASATPESIVEWKKRVEFGPQHTKAIAAKMTPADYENMKKSRDEIAREVKFYTDQFGAAKGDEQINSLIQSYGPRQLKHQTLRETIEDYDILHGRMQGEKEGFQEPQKSRISPRRQKIIDDYKKYEEALNKIPLAQRQSKVGRKNAESGLLETASELGAEASRNTPLGKRAPFRGDVIEGPQHPNKNQDDILVENMQALDDRINAALNITQRRIRNSSFDGDKGFKGLSLDARIEILQRVKEDLLRTGLDRNSEGRPDLGASIQRRASNEINKYIADPSLRHVSLNKPSESTGKSIEDIIPGEDPTSEETLGDTLPEEIDTPEIVTKTPEKTVEPMGEVVKTAPKMQLTVNEWYERIENNREDAVERFGEDSSQVEAIDEILGRLGQVKDNRIMTQAEVMGRRMQGENEGFSKSREVEDFRAFQTTTEKVLEDKTWLAHNPNAKYLKTQSLLKRLEQVVPKEEIEMLNALGFQDFVKSQDGYIDLEKAKTWVREHEPKVQVHTYGAEGKVSEAAKELGKMQHEWYEKLDDKVQARVDQASYRHNRNETGSADYHISRLPEEIQTNARKYIELEKVARKELYASKHDTTPRMTGQQVGAYDRVSPKDPKKYPVQRVDVVMPQKKMSMEEYGKLTYEQQKELGSIVPEKGQAVKTIWQPDSLHEQHPNTLGWAAIQYETLPNGEKVAHIFEAQSRWGQEVREAKKQQATNEKYHYAQHGPEAKLEDSKYIKELNHPLLTEYNRLILKAAMQQARKEGATHIAISDAETAMMTEWHDQPATRIEPGVAREIQQRRDRGELTAGQYADAITAEHKRSGKIVIEQEPGMRLNYDTILPDMLAKLTGDKGERVSFGEHKNAFDVGTHIDRANRTTSDTFTPRDNLIFKNPDGTPKTDVTANVYKLPPERPGEPNTYFGKRYQGESEGFSDEYNRPFETDSSKQSFIEPLAAAYDKVRKISVSHAKAANNYADRRDQYIGKGNIAQVDLSKFPEEDVNRVVEELNKAYRNDETPNLSGKNDQEIVQIWQKYFGEVADIRRNIGIEIEGRRAGKNEYYVPHMLNAKTADLFTNHAASPEAMFAKKEWVDHVFNESEGKIPRDKIEQDISDYIGALGGKSNNYRTIEFGAIRRAAGYGLPESLRDLNALNVLGRYNRRAASDLAFYQEIQSKPEIAGPLKIKNIDGKIPPGYENSPLSEDKHIQRMMQWITGSVSGRGAVDAPKTTAFIRLVNNSVLGTATGVRDLASVPVNMLPYIHRFSDLAAAWDGLTQVRKNSREALETAARQPNIDRVQFNDLKNEPDRFTTLVGKAADIMRKAQGREYLENLSRDVVFSIGKSLGRNNILGAKSGNVKSKAWLEKFGNLVEGDITTMQGEELEKALNQIGKNFTDRNQGTYDGRGLPTGIVDSQFAPFLSLQKWSVEKSNVIYKDVYKPFITGENRLPMLTYALGSFMTGAAIQQLNKLMTGRKAQEPDLKEALNSDNAATKIAELATIMQLGSYAGIISDSVKMISDPVLRGTTPRNIVSFPTATAVVRTGESVTDMLEALRQGEDPWEVLKMFTLDMAVSNVQGARMIANRTLKSEDIERSDKFRDVRIFSELEGKPSSNITKTNPYLGIDEKKFKRTDDPKEAIKLARELVVEARQEVKGNPREFRKSLASLKGNSYQTMPSPTQNPEEFKRFYNFLVVNQGKQKADERVQDYLRQSMFNKQKSKLIP